MLKILFFFLHRRSQRRANMPGCLLFYPAVQPPVSAFASHAQAISVVYQFSSGHVARGPVHGMQALFELQSANCLSPVIRWRSPGCRRLLNFYACFDKL